MNTGPVVVQLRMDGQNHDEETTIEIPRELWNAMNTLQRQSYLDDKALEFMCDYITPCWNILTDEGEEWAPED